MKIVVTLAAAAVAVTSCDLFAPANTGPRGPDEAVVSGSSVSRSGARETHYAECTTATGEQFRVVPASMETQLQDGQPCPSGPRKPLPKDQYPELFEELQKPLPYGGGNLNSGCGEWQTVDKDEARRLAEQCPPLKWGDLR